MTHNPSRINVGSVDWQRNEDRVIVSPLYNVFSVSPELDQQYLYYYLKSSITLQRIKNAATGSVRDNLKLSMLCEFPINLRPIEEQRDIVRKIDQVNHIIKLRHQELQKLNELVKARFVEMFGNSKYPVVKASDVCEFITKGTTPPANEIINEPFENCIPYLKVYNLSFTGELLFEEQPQYINIETHEKKLMRSKVYPNDVLMNIVGPPLGKFALVPDMYPEWNINQAIAIFRAKEQVLPEFLMQALMQRDVLLPFLEKAQGVRQLNLSLDQCRNLEFALPPLNEQLSFVEFVKQCDKSKFAIQQSLAATQKLFDSLMQQYFG